MAFLELNGYPIEVLNAQVSQQQTRQGRGRRSHRGMMRDPRRGIRRTWSLTAKFQEPDEARGLEGLIAGRGHFFGFGRGLVADEPGTGLSPSFAGTFQSALMSPRINPGLGRSGLGFITVDDGDTTDFLNYPAQLGPDWSIFWADSQVPSGLATWDMWGKTSDGKLYRNAAVASSAFTFDPIVENGDVRITTACGCEAGLTDLVILPWRASEAQVIAWTTPGVDRWGPLPVLRMTGDIIDKPATFVVGELSSSPFQQRGAASKALPSAGGARWSNADKVIRFTLAEVDDQYLSGSGLEGARAVAGFVDTQVKPPAQPDFWFDASWTGTVGNTMIQDDDQIATWSDKGTLGSNASSIATDPVYRRVDLTPATAVFPHQHVEFVNLGGMETGSVGSTGSIRRIVAIVGRFDSLAGQDVMLDGISGGTSRVIFRVLNTGAVRAQVTSTLDSGMGIITAGEWFYAVIDFNAASSVIRVNGVQVAAGSTGPLANVAGLTLGEFNTFVGGGSDLDGAIAEVLLWDAEDLDLTAPNPYAEIERYLLARYPELT